MPNDINQYKNRLSDYLDHKGITKKKDRYSCVSSQHEDSDPSAKIYENGGNNKLNCNSCGFKGDIFDCAGELIGMKGQDNFQDQLKEIQSVFGGEPLPMKPIKKQQTKKQEINVVPLPRKEALEKFSLETVLKKCSGVFNGYDDKALAEDHKDYRKFHDVDWFAYYDEAGLINLMVIRFEDQNGKKEVLTYYWNGKYVAMKAYPILIYGRDQLANNPDLPVLIHEGEKCVKIAMESMPEFVHIGWNGGGKKFYLPDWSVLKGREVFLLPDDDIPGIDTMEKLSKLLAGDYGIKSIQIPIFEKAKSIKKKGADIEEILQVYSPEEITKTIFNLRGKNVKCNTSDDQHTFDGDNGIHNDDNSIHRGDSDGDVSNNSNHFSGNYPFKILGIADDGRAYFLDHTDRMASLETTAINSNTLSDIGTYKYFKQSYFNNHDPTAKEWLTVIDKIRILSKNMDFDMEKVRGRGAWKDDEGNICYHDGKETTGDYDPEWTFIRKPKNDIGINSEPCDLGTRKEIIEIARTFSFSTMADVVRLLSHAVLAPFGGALSWRPAIMVTGPSGSGKSTVVDFVAKPIAGAKIPWGGSTSEAAIRQYSANDSTPEYLDEMDGKRPKDRERIEDIYSLMRSSTSDQSPVTGKGSISGKVSLFRMRSMFCFVAVNDSVENTADDNRIIRVNFKESNNKEIYLKNIQKITKLLSKKVCDSLRAFTWDNLPKIIKLGERLELIIQIVTSQDARFAAGESILLAANLVVWEGFEDKLEDDFLKEYVTDFYSVQSLETKRDETEEMINRLLDETVMVGDDRKKYSFRYLLKEMKYYLGQKASVDKMERDDYGALKISSTKITSEVYQDYKRVVEQYGLSVHKKSRELAIVQNHHKIMEILNMTKGYHRQLARHKNTLYASISVNIDSGTKRATVIAGFLEYNIEEE